MMLAPDLIRLCAERGAELAERGGRLIIRNGAALDETEYDLVRRHQRLLVRTLHQSHPQFPAGRPTNSELKEQLPLTPYQMTFHLLSRNSEKLPVVNQAGLFVLENFPESGDQRALPEAFSALVRRHDALRTFFITPPGELPYQSVASAATIPVQVIRASDRIEAERSARETADTFRHTPYDLQRPPLLRSALVRHAPDQAILVLGLHHLIMDGWSTGIIIRDLLACLASGENEALLPDLPFSHADYARWLCDLHLPAVKVTQTAFWQNELIGARPVHSLPLDFQPSFSDEEENNSDERKLCQAFISLTQAAPLRQWASRSGCGLFSALHTGLRLLMYRLGGDTDVPVLTVAANRDLPGQEHMAGCFVNVVPLFTRLNPAQTLVQALKESRQTLLAALDNQSLPFQDIVAAAPWSRRPGHHPISQVLLTLQNAYSIAGSTTAEPLLPEYSISAYDLAIVAWEKSDGSLAVHLEYDGALFRRASMEHFLGVYTACLAELPLQGETTPDLLRVPGLPNPGQSSATSVGPEEKARQAASLLQLASYRGVAIPEADFDSGTKTPLLLAAKLFEKPVSPARPEGDEPILAICPAWPNEEFLARWPKVQVCVVNHLPPAGFILEQSDHADRIRLLLELPGSGGYALADLKSITTGRETGIEADLPPGSLPEPAVFGQLEQLAPGLRIRHLGPGKMTLPLPGNSQPWLWRNGRAVNLDRAALDLPAPWPNQVVLGFSFPPPGEDSLLNPQGEIIAWTTLTRSGINLEDLNRHLPGALAASHLTHLAQFPRDGNQIARDVLERLPVVSEEVAARLSSRLTESGTERKTVVTLESAAQPEMKSEESLFIPAGPADEFIPFEPPPFPVSGWDSPLAGDRFCLLALSGGESDALLLESLLHSSRANFMLYGPGAEKLAGRADTQRVGSVQGLPGQALQTAAANFNLRAGGLVHILGGGAPVDLATIAAINQALYSQEPGTVAVHLRLGTPDDFFSEEGRDHWASLVRQAAEVNRDAPHTAVCLALIQPVPPSPDELWDFLRVALRSGQDVVVAADESELIWWGALSRRSALSQQIRVAGVSPGTSLPHPLADSAGRKAVVFDTAYPNESESHDLQTSIRETLSRIWIDVLQIQSQDPEANFFDLGGTSVMAPMLRERIQKKLGVDIGVTGVFLHPCLRELEGAVRKRLASPADRKESAAPPMDDYSPDPERENRQARQQARQRRFSQQASLT